MKKKNENEITQLNIEVPSGLHQALKAVAALTGMPLRELGAAALEYFAGETSPELEKLHKRCTEASKRLRKPFNQPEFQFFTRGNLVEA